MWRWLKERPVFPQPPGSNTISHSDERAPALSHNVAPPLSQLPWIRKAVVPGSMCALQTRVSEGHCWESSPLGWWAAGGNLPVPGLPSLFPAWASLTCLCNHLLRHLSELCTGWVRIFRISVGSTLMDPRPWVSPDLDGEKAPGWGTGEQAPLEGAHG